MRRLRQQRGAARQHRLGCHLLRSAAAGGIRENLPPHLRGRSAQAISHQRQRMGLKPPRSRLAFQEVCDRGNALQQVLLWFRCHSLPSFNHALAPLSMIFGELRNKKAPGDRRQGGGGGEPRGKKRSITGLLHVYVSPPHSAQRYLAFVDRILRALAVVAQASRLRGRGRPARRCSWPLVVVRCGNSQAGRLRHYVSGPALPPMCRPSPR